MIVHIPFEWCLQMRGREGERHTNHQQHFFFFFKWQRKSNMSYATKEPYQFLPCCWNLLTQKCRYGSNRSDFSNSHSVTVRRAWTTVCGNEKVERRESLSREVGKHVRTSWWNPAQSSNVYSKHSICLAPREEVYDTEVHLPAHTNAYTQLLRGYLLCLSEHQTSCR